MIDIDDLRRGLSEIAAEADAVDLRERALATSHRVRVRRTASAVVTGLAIVAVALGAAVGVRTDRSPAPSGTTPAPTAPEPTTLPTEQQSGQPDLGPLAAATITVPTWGATADTTCTTGRVTLTGGQSPGDGPHRAVNVLSYVATDVDRDGTEDYVAHLMCGEGPESGGSQIVGFRRDGRNFVPLGRVVGTQDGLAMMDHLEARGDGRVAVLVSKEYTDGGQNSVPNQWRTYAWRNGRFQQLGGPTTFPGRSPVARLSVVPSTLPIRPAGDGFTGRLTVAVSNDGDVDVARLQILLVLPSQVRPAGAGWKGCAVRPSSDQTALVCTVPGPRARSRISVPFTLVSDDRPVLLDEPVDLGNHYVSISQVPPFDGQVTIDEPEAVIPISVP
ncbi:hypothetical protein [Micromonospora siamensis]|nr:hypothetical protein [Micromonospora siamensis]